MTATAPVPGPPATARRQSTRVWVEQVMGTPISVHVRGRAGQEVDIAVAQAFSHLQRVDAVCSAWRPDSDLARVRRGELAEDAGHPWLAEVRALCEEAQERAEGLFSASVGGGRTPYDPTGLVKGWAVEGAARRWPCPTGSPAASMPAVTSSQGPPGPLGPRRRGASASRTRVIAPASPGPWS